MAIREARDSDLPTGSTYKEVQHLWRIFELEVVSQISYPLQPC